MTTSNTDSSGIVTGTVTYADSGAPVRESEVRVFDSDLFFDDPLGTATTDEEGRYQVEYGIEDYQDIFEGQPDVFVEVRDDGNFLTSTKDCVVREAGSKETIHVEVPGRGPDEPEEPRERTTTVGGYPLNREAYEALEPDDLIEIASALRGDDPDAAGIERLVELNPKLGRMVRGPSMSATPVVRTLTEIALEKDWHREVLLELEEIFDGPSFDGFSTYSCGKFDIEYDTSGTLAVPSDDTNSNITMPGDGTNVGSTSANGIPDYVERLCFWLNRAYSIYSSAPYSLTSPTGGGTIQVKIDQDEGDFRWPGYVNGGTVHMGHELDDHFLAWVAVHELMHVFQDEYESSGKSGGWYPGMSEGGATLAEDTIIDPINRYAAEAEDFLGGEGPLDGPEVSLNSHSYELSLFLKYISEQQSGNVRSTDEPQIGAETYRKLLEEFDASGYDTAAIEDAIHGLPWYQRYDSFDYLDPAEKDLMNGETLLGNFWLACYCKDLGSDEPDRRFDFMEDEQAIDADDIVPTSVSTTTYGTMGSVDLARDETLSAGGTLTLASGSSSVSDFAARFYRIDIESGVDTIELDVGTPPGSSLSDPIVQAVLVEPGDTVRDILRTDHEDWTRTIANERDGTKLDHVAVVVAAGENGGQFSLTVSEVAATPDVTITRWHTSAGDHYEIDPFGWSWTWTSPDVWVDNDGDGVADDEVHFNQNNDLFVRLRNQGNADASGVDVEFWYQDASSGLSPSAWQQVRDASGNVQTLNGLSIPADTTDRFSVQWAPSPSGGSNHFCVRAVISAPGDPNEENKRVLSNFGNVVHSGPFADLTWIRRRLREDLHPAVRVVPRVHGHYEVSRMDLDRIERATVEEPRLEELRVRRRDAEAVQGEVREEAEDASLEVPVDDDWREELTWNVCTTGSSLHEVPSEPDLRQHYPTDPDALPPGVDEAADLVTVTQVEDGQVSGGFTWALREE